MQSRSSRFFRIPQGLIPRSLTNRVFALYSVTLVAIVLGGVGLFLRFQFIRGVEDTQLSAVMLIELAQSAVQDSAVIGDYDTLKKTLDRAVQSSTFSQAKFIGMDGGTIEVRDRSLESATAPAWLTNWTAHQFPDVNRVVAVGGKDYGVLRLQFDTGSVANRLWSLLLYFSSAVAASLVLGLGVMRYALSRWLGNLDRLQAFGAALGTGTLGASDLHIEGAPTEISQIVEMFNRTASLVREREESRRALANQKFALDQHAIVSIADLSGNITYANDRFCEISGYTRAELLGQNHRFIGSGAHPPQFFQDLWNTITQGRVWHGEIENRTKSDQRYWVVVTIVPLMDGNGRPEQYIAIRTDVSQRKRVEVEKALLLEKYKLLTADLEAKTLALEQSRAVELDIGYRIQQTLLVAPPDWAQRGLWLSAYNQPSKGIDGDFFDVFRVGTDAVDIVLGDVMGKGVPAALLGAATKLQLSRSMAELLVERASDGGPPQPKDVVRRVNQKMAPSLQALNAFVTLVYLRIDVQRDTLTWLGCGHEETLVVDASGAMTLLGNQHTPIGLFLDEDYEQSVRKLLPGESVFLSSDGISDAIVSAGERIGRDAVNACVIRQLSAHGSPAMALHGMRRELLPEGVTTVDDVTMVLLTRPDSQRQLNRLEFPATLGSLPMIREFIQAQVGEIAQDRTGLVTVAAVEVVTNLIRHARGLLPRAPIEVICEHTKTEIEIEFKYIGEPFAPTHERSEVDLSTMPEGGFGLYIIEHACDQVSYLHHQGVNSIRLHINRST
jgi:PAS domain S-box-containing protein